MEAIIIVGGGVAGLACLNALLDLGVDATLLEANQVGTPKLCGEFLAPTALPQLDAWEIGSIEWIRQIEFNVKQQTVRVALPQPAGAFSRQALELALCARARRLGGTVLENTPLQDVQPPNTLTAPYRLTLADKTLEAKHVIFATGQWGQQRSLPAMPYVGFKTHIDHVLARETLWMSSQDNAYFGVVPVSATQSNWTCLLRHRVTESMSPQDVVQRIWQTEPLLRELLRDNAFETLTWITGKAPHFGLKKLPSWPRALWIGDALASVYPALGYGFAHSVESAVFAAHCYQQQETARFHTVSRNKLKTKLQVGKLLHHLLLQPKVSSVLMPVIQQYPRMAQFLLRRIGYVG